MLVSSTGIVETTTPPSVRSSNSVKSTVCIGRHIPVVYAKTRIINITFSIETEVPLELLLGQSLTLVQLGENQVLHLRPCNAYRSTAVHVLVTEGNSYRIVVLNHINNTELDITVTNDVTVSVNEVNTDQRLTADNLTSSCFILDSLTTISYWTWIEYCRVISILLDVLWFTSLGTNCIVYDGEVVVQTESIHRLLAHYLLCAIEAILNLWLIGEVSLNELWKVNWTIVSNAVSSRHRNSTVTILVICIIITHALIEVIVANLVVTRFVYYECFLWKSSLRIIVSQSNDGINTRKYNCIVRCNDSVFIVITVNYTCFW